VLRVGDEQLAGIMDGGGYLAPHALTSWTVVFYVEDTDATLDQVLELGGGVRRPAHDSPYGRLATVEDPMGAKFALISGG
jgi:predicted enzyme related to lactoylglutathione lyase